MSDEDVVNSDSQEEPVATEDPVKEEPEKVEPEKVEPEAPKVPEEYENFTLPDGVEADEAMMDEFKPLAKELGLTQEAAQKLVDLQTKHALALAEAEQGEWNDLVKQWEAVAKSDKEIGGDKLDEARANAKKAVEKLGTTEFAEMLEWTGTGSNPEMIRLLNRVYTQFLAEDKVEKVNASPPPDTASRSRGQRMFPSMTDN